MRTFYSFCFLIFCLYSNAQFSKGYAPSHWSTYLTPGSNGSVNATGAPNSITLTGSDGTSATNMDVDYTITALATGVFSFNWSYHTNDQAADPSWDPAGVIINGSFNQLTNDVGTVDQSGTFSTSVTAGTTIGFRVRAIDNLEGTATLSISSFSPPGGILPIILSSFGGQKQNNEVRLDWSSSLETNFSHFIVERSGGATNFSALQTVSANTSHHYELIDEHPLSGRNFYRLKMVDNDGSVAYSKTIAVDMGNLVQQVSVWPNPTTGDVIVRIDATTVLTETLTIINSAGATVFKQEMILRKGTNENQINLSAVPKGMYFIQLQTAGTTIKIIKQ